MNSTRKEDTFEQAQAQVKRLMEFAGGSVDAYEETPLQNPGPLIEALQAKDDPKGPEGDVPDLDLDPVPDWEDVRNLWTNPPPVSNIYELHSVVEDSPELMHIHNAFKRARHHQGGEGQVAIIESGSYPVDRSDTGRGWQIHDTGKNRRYVAEHPSMYGDVVSEKDLFIWVMAGTDSEINLGYIHMGYVFLLVGR